MGENRGRISRYLLCDMSKKEGRINFNWLLSEKQRIEKAGGPLMKIDCEMRGEYRKCALFHANPVAAENEMHHQNTDSVQSEPSEIEPKYVDSNYGDCLEKWLRHYLPDDINAIQDSLPAKIKYRKQR